MDFEQLKENLLPIVRKHLLPLGLGLLGLILVLYGLIFSSSNQSQKQEDLQFVQGASDKASAASLIFVDVEGAVEKPGVYKVGTDARIKDALVAAGGLSSKADRDWAAKTLNLASKVTDGQKIYVKTAGENSTAQSQTDTLGSSSISGLININSASSKELDALPGIGEVTAGKIINARPYGSVDELFSKKIVTQKVFDQIKDKISVY